MPRASSVARASSTSEPAQEEPQASQSSVERLPDRRGCGCCDGRDCRTTAPGRAVRPSVGDAHAVRRRDCSTQPSATLSSSTSASPSVQRSSLRECSSEADASHCRRGTPRTARRSSRKILGAVADADVPPPTGIPAGPSFFQFADDAVFAARRRRCGFHRDQVDAISFEVPLRSAEDRRSPGSSTARSKRRHFYEAETRRKPLSSASRWRCSSSHGDAGRPTSSRHQSRSPADESRREPAPVDERKSRQFGSYTAQIEVLPSTTAWRSTPDRPPVATATRRER